MAKGRLSTATANARIILVIMGLIRTDQACNVKEKRLRANRIHRDRSGVKERSQRSDLVKQRLNEAGAIGRWTAANKKASRRTPEKPKTKEMLVNSGPGNDYCRCRRQYPEGCRILCCWSVEPSHPGTKHCRAFRGLNWSKMHRRQHPHCSFRVRDSTMNHQHQTNNHRPCCRV